MTLECVNHLQCDTIPIFLEARWNFRSIAYLSDAAPRSTSDAATALAVCEQVSVVPSFVH